MAAYSLADVAREEFSYVDADKDGRISKEELLSFWAAKDTTIDEDPTPWVNLWVDQRMKLSDLNSDGIVSTDEFLIYLTLDSGGTDGFVNGDLLVVFDSNEDGWMEIKEWTSALGDFGTGGRQTQEFIFRRVDRLGAGTGKLDVEGFATAFEELRTVVVGLSDPTQLPVSDPTQLPIDPTPLPMAASPLPLDPTQLPGSDPPPLPMVVSLLPLDPTQLPVSDLTQLLMVACPLPAA